MGLDGVVYEKDFGPAAGKCVSGIADSTSKSWIVNSTVFRPLLALYSVLECNEVSNSRI
jgi:hypothetical protein